MLEQQSVKGFTELENAVLTVNSKSFKTYGDMMMGFAGIFMERHLKLSSV